MRTLFLRTVLTALTLLIPLAAWAQTGKISGTITDRETGEPLPGANVIIEGTQRGAAADVNGEYIILNVTPGTYTLRARFVGYGDQLIEGVEVNSNFTTIVDFEMGAGIELEEVVVRGERLIRQDEVGTTAVLSGEEFQQLPVQGFQQAISVASGVVEDNGQIYIRGGRSSEIAYLVDGVLVRDPWDSSIGSFDLPRQSVNELQVLSGGFNAEYGEAMSGVVLVNTPTGGDELRGNVRFQTDGYSLEGLGEGGPSRDFQRPFSNDWGTRIGEVSLSGPIVQDKITFFINADRLDSDTYLNEFAGPVRPATFPYNELVGYTFYRPTADLLDADGNELDAADFGLEEGTVITQEMVDQLAAAGVDVANVKGAISDYQTIHSQGLYNDRTRLTSNLMFRPTQDIDLKVGYNMTRRDWRAYSHVNKEFPEYNAPQHRQIDIGTVNWTHRLSSKMFYELTGAYHRNAYQNYLYDEQMDEDDPYRFGRIFPEYAVDGSFDTDGLSNVEGGNEYDFYGFVEAQIRADNPYLLTGDLGRPYLLSRNLDLDGDGTIDYRGGDERTADRLTQELLDRLASLSQEDLDRLGLQAGLVPILSPPTDNFFWDARTKEYQFKGAVTAQVNNRNLLKIGGEFHQYDIFDYQINANADWDPSTDPGDPNTVTNRPEQETYVDAKPYQFAAYAQDKIEFANLVIQAGLRFDAIDPAVSGIVGYGSGAPVRRGEAVVEDAKLRTSFSPRLGVAFPITDRARLSFNYGQFFQYPSYDRLYLSYRTATWVPGSGYTPLEQPGFDLGFETFLGNPNLEPETTVSYQIDGEFLVNENMKLGASLFYKDVYDYVSTVRIEGVGGTPYWILDNLDYANARGFEIRAERRLVEYVGFTTSYTYSRAFGNADAYDERYDEWDLFNAYGFIPPKNALPLDWDQPHTLSFSATGRYAGFFTSFVGAFGSGLPYTPTTSRGKPSGPKNSARRPWTGNVDMRLEYQLDFGELTYLRPFVEVTNLFDRTNVLTVFTSTGSPYFTQDIGTQYEDAQRPNYFGPPRHVEVGLQIGF